jgi:hypothetical protein
MPGFNETECNSENGTDLSGGSVRGIESSLLGCKTFVQTVVPTNVFAWTRLAEGLRIPRKPADSELSCYADRDEC